MASTSDAAAGGREHGELLGHPKGLFVLFFAEMWERFSYYGMRALLIFYLTQHWLFSDSKASIIYGAYTSLVYITPVLGGYLADRWLGQRKAVLFGAVLLAIGHTLMAFEGSGGHEINPMINVFWLALSFIIVGSGFLKANISVIVGQLYPRTDARRDGAYTIFYMGINVGAALGSILCGLIGQVYGWKYGFGLAGIGMLAGLVVFIWGKPLLLGRGEAPDPVRLTKPVAAVLKLEWLLYIIGLAAVGGIWFLIQYQDVVGTLLLGFGVILLGYILYIAVARLERQDRDRIFAIIFLIALQPLFWGLFEQAGSSLNLFTDRYVDREILGITIPAAVFQSINPIYIVIFGPVFAWLWLALGKRGWEPSTPFKFGLGIIQLGLGFLVLVLGAGAFGMENATPVLFIFLIYLLHTTGELCLSPVGLSAMNRLAPAHMASLIMGAWFFATAGGNFVAGMIASATGTGGHGAGAGDAPGKETVIDVYLTIGLVAVGIGVLVMFVSPLVKKLMHLDTLTDHEELAGYEEIGEAQAAGAHPDQEESAPENPRG